MKNSNKKVATATSEVANTSSPNYLDPCFEYLSPILYVMPSNHFSKVGEFWINIQKGENRGVNFERYRIVQIVKLDKQFYCVGAYALIFDERKNIPDIAQKGALCLTHYLSK